MGCLIRPITEKPLKHYNNLDWIRLLLAVQVVAIHSGLFPTVFINPVPGFLALTGFVVMGSIERNTVPQFFINRALRVLPALFASFIAVWVIFDGAEMLKTIKYWLIPVGDAPVNAVVWSLIYEEFFYALVAVLFSFGLYRTKVVPIGLAIVFAVTAMVFAFPPGILRPAILLGAAFFLGNVAWTYRTQIQRIHPLFATAFFVGMLAFIFTLPYERVADPYRAGWDLLAFAAMLIFGIAGPKFPRLSIDLSYSLYLVHCLVRAFFLGVVPLGLGMFWRVLLISIPISVASWFLIERPALKFKGRLKMARNANQTRAAEAR